ncbi:unnamed protein product [Closterium sp. NIES-54]
MYALSVSAEGDCYLCVPPAPGITNGIAPAALGACESAPPGPAPAQALQNFTLDSGASSCFFRDSTTVTPLPAPVPVSLADPSGGPVLARSSTVLPCPTIPSGELSGLHLPSFSTNLTGRHLATFARAPGSSLYTHTTASHSAPLSPQLHASAQVSTQCECRRLSHDTLLWHHRLGHPSLPRLRSIHSRFLVSCLPRSLPPLPPSLAPPCIPCVEGRQRAAPHSSSFPPTEAPLQTLHLDVWGPARVRGQGHERYFLLVVNDYTRCTTVFPLQRKGGVPDVLIPWIRATRLQLRERFQSEFPVLRLHSDIGGEFSLNLLAAFCAEHGIRQTFTLPASPQQNGVAEHRIGLVMEVARTSMIHAAAPHFLWPFAVRYAAHQLNLWPRVSLPETSPTLLWTGKVGDASRFWVWDARAFVRDTTADKLSPRAIPCVFLGFVPDAPGWQFYDPASRRVFASQDGTFDESVPFYRLFPYRTAPRPPPPPLFLAPGPPHVDPLPAPGPAPSGVSQVDPPAPAPIEVTGDSGLAGSGAVPGGAELGGAESGGAERVEPGGAETGREEPGGAASRGTVSGGAASWGRGDVVLTGHSDASWVDDQATQRSSQGYTFSLGSGSVSWRSTRSSSVLGSNCEAEIYATAMAAQELCWLTYLLTDLGERPRSPPVLYVDNKATIALCQEHRLEHRTKHIALHYFLARELHQRGQLCLTYVATWANTADRFTKALPPGRARVVLTSHADTSWVDDLATQRSSLGYTFSLGSGSVSWRSTRSSSVLSSSCEAEIYAGAMAAQELHWLTYLLTNLGEVPRSPPVLYVENKAMLALCQEHRLEHRTKHIALRYFLARELQQRGQLRLAYVASQANTADVFTKALQPCDHQRFCTILGLVPTVPHLLTS